MEQRKVNFSDNKKTLVLIVSFLYLANIVFAQGSKIEIPPFDDKYSKYVGQLESGDLNIDYADFRNSYLDSKHFRKKRRSNYDSLKTLTYAEIKNKDYPEVIKLTKAMLSIDYTSLFAHKYLQQTYKILGDTLNQKKYHDIEFGLLNSIVKSGDGKTCESGWHVIQIEEEYFILNMIGAQFQSQSISSSPKNVCDKMVVKTEDGEATYYFEANKVFEMEKKLFEK
jgi:hypothetical protein